MHFQERPAQLEPGKAAWPALVPKEGGKEAHVLRGLGHSQTHTLRLAEVQF